MPVLTSSDRLAPKSLIRHRPIDSDTKVTEPPRVPRASRTQTHKPSVTPKPSGATVPIDVPVWKHSGKPSRPGSLDGKKQLLMQGSPQTWHWTILVGLTMMGMVLLALVVQLVWSWGTGISNDIHYGMPRTTQVDAYVGHESGKTPSHFIAENLRGKVLIIEFPGGDVQHARIFVGPQISGTDADQEPITLSFVDHKGDHHPDMIVHFGSVEVWYANQHGTFVLQ